MDWSEERKKKYRQLNELLKSGGISLGEFKNEIMMLELASLPRSEHDCGVDAAALAPDRTTVSKFKEYKDVKVDIPVKNYFDKPEIQYISNRLGKDIEKEMTDFGNKNGFPVIFVFCPFKSEMKDGICKCSSEVKFFKADEMEEAVSFARLNGTECVGKFVPYQKLEEIR